MHRRLFLAGVGAAGLITPALAQGAPPDWVVQARARFASSVDKMTLGLIQRDVPADQAQEMAHAVAAVEVVRVWALQDDDAQRRPAAQLLVDGMFEHIGRGVLLCRELANAALHLGPDQLALLPGLIRTAPEEIAPYAPGVLTDDGWLTLVEGAAQSLEGGQAPRTLRRMRRRIDRAESLATGTAVGVGSGVPDNHGGRVMHMGPKAMKALGILVIGAAVVAGVYCIVGGIATIAECICLGFVLLLMGLSVLVLGGVLGRSILIRSGRPAGTRITRLGLQPDGLFSEPLVQVDGNASFGVIVDDDTLDPGGEPLVDFAPLGALLAQVDDKTLWIQPKVWTSNVPGVVRLGINATEGSGHLAVQLFTRLLWIP
jgi:hypothetical protein